MGPKISCGGTHVRQKKGRRQWGPSGKIPVNNWGSGGQYPKQRGELGNEALYFGGGGGMGTLLPGVFVQDRWGRHVRPAKIRTGGNRVPSRLSRRTACEPATNNESSGANWGTKISVREDDDLSNKLRAALAATAPDWKAWLISSPE